MIRIFLLAIFPCKWLYRHLYIHVSFLILFQSIVSQYSTNTHHFFRCKKDIPLLLEACMRHVRLFTLGALICALTVFPFVGCSMESESSIPPESSPLTPYEASGFDDLLNIDDVTVVTDLALVDMSTYSLADDVEFALRSSAQAGLLGILDTIIPSKKSMSAAVTMQVRDEVIAWEDLPFTYTATIDHLDLELEGGISSVSTILELIPLALIPDSITGAASVQLSSKIHTANSASLTLPHEFSESIYLSLGVEHTETITSRTDDSIEIPVSGPIDADFKYSLASLFSLAPGGSFPVVIPSVFEMELKPIRNLTLQSIVDALIAAEFQGASIPNPADENYVAEMQTFVDSIVELFTIIKPIIWGNSDEPGLRITRKVMKKNRDVVVLEEATDAEALVTLILAMRRFN